jgi:hypothetical protein
MLGSLPVALSSTLLEQHGLKRKGVASAMLNVVQKNGGCEYKDKNNEDGDDDNSSSTYAHGIVRH